MVFLDKKGADDITEKSHWCAYWKARARNGIFEKIAYLKFFANVHKYVISILVPLQIIDNCTIKPLLTSSCQCVFCQCKFVEICQTMHK